MLNNQIIEAARIALTHHDHKLTEARQRTKLRGKLVGAILIPVGICIQA
jgi:hypothetical protein